VWELSEPQVFDHTHKSAQVAGVAAIAIIFLLGCPLAKTGVDEGFRFLFQDLDQDEFDR